MSLMLYCTSARFDVVLLSKCFWHRDDLWNYKCKSKKYTIDCVRGHIVSWIFNQLRSVLSDLFWVCAAHTCVCIMGSAFRGSSAVSWFVVVLVLRGQGRPGLLHLLALLSTPTAAGFGWVYHHTELLAQVRHLICGARIHDEVKGCCLQHK